MSVSDRDVALVVHSGGPTAVINASLLGVIEEAARHSAIGRVYGARHGIEGVLNEDFIRLDNQPAELLAAVARTPSSALGTSRKELSEADADRVMRVLRDYGIGFLFYTGGNGSMGTAYRIHRLAVQAGQQLQVIGVPKTIDNDLYGTNHSPGYGSAAKFFACSVRDIGMDNHALGGQVEIIEVLGRSCGWIAAATILARNRDDDAPHLVYLPEYPLSLEVLLDDVLRVYSRQGRCVVVVCEGQLDTNGDPFGADVRSGSRGTLAMNLGHRLAMLVSQRLKLRARSEKPGLLGRSCLWSVSERDWTDARLCGRSAVEAAVQSGGGSMVTLLNGSPEQAMRTGLVKLELVALKERQFPANWVNKERNNVSAEFRKYVSPLVGDVPGFERLIDSPVD